MNVRLMNVRLMNGKLANVRLVNVRALRAGWLRVGALALALCAGVSGCGDVCEDAAQICADERRVAALEEDGEGEAAVCETTLEKHAQCIVDADSCAPDVVADCWESADGDSD